jgi:hypothetical protein
VPKGIKLKVSSDLTRRVPCALDLEEFSNFPIFLALYYLEPIVIKILPASVDSSLVLAVDIFKQGKRLMRRSVLPLVGVAVSRAMIIRFAVSDIDRFLANSHHRDRVQAVKMN